MDNYTQAPGPQQMTAPQPQQQHHYYPPAPSAGGSSDPVIGYPAVNKPGKEP
jgi:hypothetical protein